MVAETAGSETGSETVVTTRPTVLATPVFATPALATTCESAVDVPCVSVPCVAVPAVDVFLHVSYINLSRRPSRKAQFLSHLRTLDLPPSSTLTRISGVDGAALSESELPKASNFNSKYWNPGAVATSVASSLTSPLSATPKAGNFPTS